MSQSIGQKLAAARQKRSLSIEDVAHKTRIHPDTLRHLEDDDYTAFANLTYAKSFLSMYSRHLDVDATAVLKEFGSETGGGNNGHSFLAPSSRTDNNSDADPFAAIAEPPRRQPLFVLLALVFILVSFPTMYMLGKRSGLKSAVHPSPGAANTSAAEAPSSPATPVTPDPEPRENVTPGPSALPPIPLREPTPASEPVSPAKPSVVLDEGSASSPPTVFDAALGTNPLDREIRRPSLLAEDPTDEDVEAAGNNDGATEPETTPAMTEDEEVADAGEPDAPAPPEAEEPVAEPEPEPIPKAKPVVRSYPEKDPPNLAKDEKPEEKERGFPRFNPFRRR